MQYFGFRMSANLLLWASQDFASFPHPTKCEQFKLTRTEGISITRTYSWFAIKLPVASTNNQSWEKVRLLSGTSWGASKKCWIISYTELLLDMWLECGIESYLFSPKYVLKAIQRLQNIGLRILWCHGKHSSMCPSAFLPWIICSYQTSSSLFDA